MLILIVIAMKIAARRHNYQVKYSSSYVEHQTQSAEHQAWTSSSKGPWELICSAAHRPGSTLPPRLCLLVNHLKMMMEQKEGRGCDKWPCFAQQVPKNKARSLTKRSFCPPCSCLHFRGHSDSHLSLNVSGY